MPHRLAHVTTPRSNILRFNTCGCVDDGKSTLIGRLLYDSKSLMEDQLEALERSADITGGGQINLANLTDGLRAEREQGITIDVAYRYFATPRRKFIIADTPGHVQYTRNMVTGASHGEPFHRARRCARSASSSKAAATPTSRRCCAFRISSSRSTRWTSSAGARSASSKSATQFEEFLPRLDIKDVKFIPISALNGDNVVDAVPEHAVVCRPDAARPSGDRPHRAAIGT